MMINKSQYLNEELSYLRNGLLVAVREHRSGTVPELLRVYVSVLQTFVRALKRVGAQYSMELARSEMGDIFGGWPELRKVEDDYRELVQEALKTKNRTIVDDVAYFPFSIAHIGIMENDPYTYAESLRWIKYCAFRALELNDERERRHIIGRLTAHLTEMADFYVKRVLDDAQEPDEIERVADIAGALVVAFSDPMKWAYERLDLESFTALLSALKRSFRYSFDRSRVGDIETQRWRLENAEMSTEERSEHERILRLGVAVNDAKVNIDSLRNQLRFGMQSWIVKEYAVVEQDLEKREKFYEELGSYENLETLTKTFFACGEKNTDELFGWMWWGLEGTSDEFAAVRTDEHHARLYCLKLLQHIQGKPVDQVERVRLPVKKSIIHLADKEDALLPSLLNNIRANASRWGRLIGPAALEGIDTARNLLRLSVNLQRNEEIRRLIEAPLDTRIVEGFKQGLISGWRENAVFRKIIHRVGAPYHVGGEAPENFGFYGFNRADPKDIYVEGSSSSGVGWGENYGREIAGNEDSVVIKQILSSVQLLNIKDTHDVKQQLDQALAALRDRKMDPNVIMFFHSWQFRTELFRSGNRWKPNTGVGSQRNEPLGFYSGIPVYDISVSMDRGSVIVADLSQLGEWRQFRARQLVAGEEYLDVFSFLLQPYSSERARELIAKSSDWLKDPRSKQVRTPEEAELEIRQRVHVRIVEQFEYAIHKPNAGVRFAIGMD